MSYYDHQYEMALDAVLQTGSIKSDRTGTGTRSLFGLRMQWDLSKGFPLITTKKIHIKSVVAELIWMLSGSTNVLDLQAMGCTIWDEWANESGDLGPVYGHQFRRAGSKPAVRIRPPARIRRGVEPTYLGVANGSGSTKSELGKTWEGMIARCYDPKSISYPSYGAKGVYVCDRWLEFSVFNEDARRLPGYGLTTAAGERLVLDKDLKGSGFEYGPDSCVWMTDKENLRLCTTKVYVVEKAGVTYELTSVTDFCQEHGIEAANFGDLWTGNKNAKKRGGFRLVEVRDTNKGVDQISAIVKGIKTNPDSRRHVVSAWNPTDVPGMALAPCHCLFQFHVETMRLDERYAAFTRRIIGLKDPHLKLVSLDGGAKEHEFFDQAGISRSKLSCQLYQRSADMFLGVPFNIASYALLTHMVAQQVDMEVGDFIWVGGDCHVYNNHVDQVKEQLSRTGTPYPQLKLSKAASIFDYKLTDVEFLDYNPGAAIKAPVAV